MSNDNGVNKRARLSSCACKPCKKSKQKCDGAEGQVCTGCIRRGTPEACVFERLLDGRRQRQKKSARAGQTPRNAHHDVQLPVVDAGPWSDNSWPLNAGFPVPGAVPFGAAAAFPAGVPFGAAAAFGAAAGFPDAAGFLVAADFPVGVDFPAAMPVPHSPALNYPSSSPRLQLPEYPDVAAAANPYDDRQQGFVAADWQQGFVPAGIPFSDNDQQGFVAPALALDNQQQEFAAVDPPSLDGPPFQFVNPADVFNHVDAALDTPDLPIGGFSRPASVEVSNWMVDCPNAFLAVDPTLPQPDHSHVLDAPPPFQTQQPRPSEPELPSAFDDTLFGSACEYSFWDWEPDAT
ncbi:MAG: hypothetical protein M1818_006686 [Claussenomyces sp. TS43310]|nr:MAG: hypothetical protein M1818_006686 [Claussenomyces sp. TS43310]